MSSDGQLQPPHPVTALERALVGCSRSIAEVRRQVRQAAACDATVLLTGETGVGKELAATWIHVLSARAAYPFIAINSAGVSESLIESELFGHCRGSFTDAHSNRRGKLIVADSGTVFFDEISEMTPRMQGALLRFLESGEVQQIGSDRALQHVNVRVIVATNRDLDTLVARGGFREDLFYRLNVVHIHIPPLRDRREDIPLLVERFRAAFGERTGNWPLLPADALLRLQGRDWPGNVRELESVVRRIGILGWSDQIVAGAPRPLVRATTAAGTFVRGERRRTVGDQLYEELTQKRLSFWTSVYSPFMDRQITRNDVRIVVMRGLTAARGNYRSVARLFNIPQDQYKKFLDFLRKNDCRLPYRQFR